MAATTPLFHGYPRALFGAALALWVFFSVPSAIAKEPSDRVWAFGSAVSSGDPSADRTSAVTDALTAALEQAVVREVPREVLVDNLRTLSEVVFSKAETFVQSYEVLSEYSYQGSIRVLVEAVVPLDGVYQRLQQVGIGFENKALPRILFLVNEQNPETGWPQFWWAEDAAFLVTVGEEVMSAALKEQGFPIAGHVALPPEATLEPYYYKPHLSNDEAVAVGNAFLADIVVVGSAVARPAQNTMGENLRAYKGIVSVRAVRTETGVELTAVEESDVAMGTDPVAAGRDAILKAGKLAGDTLAQRIKDEWRKIRKPEMVEINVLGTQNLKAFVRLREVIVNTPGVNSLQVKELQTEKARIVVDFASDAEELAASLMVHDFGSFGVTMTDIGQNHMNIELVTQGVDNPGSTE
ncbi:MAG: hypothetical protein LJE65_02660 [Desulfobacteraceae bacterium]|nr:hypothetical protein [Desulfobacteraceae bacterium]